MLCRVKLMQPMTRKEHQGVHAVVWGQGGQDVIRFVDTVEPRLHVPVGCQTIFRREAHMIADQGQLSKG